MQSMKAFALVALLICPGIAPAQPPGGPAPISVNEFKQRQNQLLGTEVAVQGRISCHGVGLCYLNSGNAQIVFDGSQTIGNDQERLSGCHSPLVDQQCPATVVGTVVRTYNPSIIASRIIWPADYKPSQPIPSTCPQRRADGRCVGPYGANPY